MGADALGADKTADLEAQMVMFRERATAAEGENMRLEWELAKVRRELRVADEALSAMEEDREQAASLVPDPGEVVVAKADLLAVLGLSVDAMTEEEREVFAQLDQVARAEQ